MAENQPIHNHDRSLAEAHDNDWGTLIARAVDDITHILQSEVRLLTAGIRTIFDEEIDRVLAFIATGVLMLGGAICGLAAAITFLHEYAMLPWWQSFGAVGLGLFAIAIVLGAFAKSRPETSAITEAPRPMAKLR